ncbi:MAG: FecR family protein, partial [Rikenellaceae bacterium]
KKNQDITHFFKADKIAHQTIDILEGKSDTASGELDQYIRENEFSENLIRNLTDSSTLAKMCAADKKSNLLDSLRSAQAKMNERSIRRRRTKTIVYSFVSSAAALVVVSFLLFHRSDQQEIKTNIVKNEVVKTPTLILSSGDNIALQMKDTLDEAIVMDNNKLSYAGSNKGDVTKYNTVVIPKGYTYTVVLADSTEVLLNAGSELRYPVKFGTVKREVYLKGEGFFKVTKKNIPFIVSTADVSVKVYGTVFNINTNNRKNVETLLVSGSVGVTVQGSSNEVMIKPSQLFTLNRTNKASRVENVNTENYLAWTQNLFKCDGEELSVMLDRIAIWYGVQFEFADNEINRTKIDIKISRNSELKDILKAIEKVSGAIITKTSQFKYVVE